MREILDRGPLGLDNTLYLVEKAQFTLQAATVLQKGPSQQLGGLLPCSPDEPTGNGLDLVRALSCRSANSRLPACASAQGAPQGPAPPEPHTLFFQEKHTFSSSGPFRSHGCGL